MTTNEQQESAMRQALEWIEANGGAHVGLALRRALEEQSSVEQPAVDPCKDGSCSCCWTHLDEQPAQQEPVAWGCNRYIEDDNGFQIGTDEPELAWGKYAPDDNGWWPLYTRPQAREPLLREIAALSANALDDYKLIQKLMAERQPLTDEQIYDMYNEPRSDAEMLEFARAIEAAHGIHAPTERGEKNT